MERFEIEEIITQDKHGIVFKGRIQENGEPVAIRRFFPFGKEGGGLEKEEAIAYGIAAERLAALDHFSLRSVVYGGVDPIDSIPFLVTEWIDGDPLSDVLASQTLDPALVIDVLRIALEVSIVISHILGDEAVWVETDISSIIVGSEESGRGFTFWICPLKWLGSQREVRNLLGIATLGEELLGWQKKLVSDQAGNGLGGWLKWLKRNPQSRLQEALEMLASSTGLEPPPPEEVIIRRAAGRPPIKLKQNSSMAPLLITTVVFLLVAGLAFLYTRKTSPPLIAGVDHPEQNIIRVEKDSKPLIEAAPKSAVILKKKRVAQTVNESRPSPKDDATARINALAEKMSRESLDASKKADERLEKLEVALNERNGVFSPEDSDLLESKENGQALKVRGVLRNTSTSKSGKSIYLNFSEDYDRTLIRGVLHERDFKGTYEIANFSKYVGKTLVLDGHLFKEFKSSILVKINSTEDIEVEK